ncbi:MAG: DUF1648 domain-containing protein [Nanoarchaeota archaeon]|nr:DUF1648 domain-containing protein [Nanoarchaeota archaeon]MBU1704681.1 DUF1648 domain-containing protein [Nanoarchaeota archaeon]
MKKFYLIIIAAIFLVTLYHYPSLPDKIATHWNASGNVDGYSSKAFGAFLLPVMVIVITFLFVLFPRIDPLRSNIQKFKKYYEGFILIFLLFMLMVQLQIILWNTGVKLSPNSILPIGIAILLFYTGIMLDKSKRNWFIGIRTPWTLSSDKVWDKTHKLGGKLFKISAILAALGMVFTYLLIWLIIVPILSSALFLFVYSYFVYKATKKYSK